jgi:hypothetical protein
VRRISSRISFVKSRMGASNILINHNPEGIKIPFKKDLEVSNCMGLPKDFTTEITKSTEKKTP